MKKTTFSQFLSFWVLPGLVAGTLFLAIALLTGALTTTVWAMPDAIAEALGLAAPAGYGFAPVPVLVGIVVHLTTSIVFGAIFAAVTRALRLTGWKLIAAGAVFVMIETPIALWVVLHGLLPASVFQIFLGAIPWWGSVPGRFAYGLTLALLLARHPANASLKAQPRVVPQAAQE